MPDFAEHIEITDSGLKINGEEFPYYVAKGGATLDGSEGMETLTLTLLTGRVGATVPAVRAPAVAPSPDRRACNPNCGLCRLEGKTRNEAPAPSQDSMLDAAKLSLKEAERLEAQAQRQVGGYKATPRTSFEAARDELLLASAQASIAVAEALGTERPAFDAAIANARTWRDAAAPAQGDTPADARERLATNLLASLDDANRISRDQTALLERFCRELDE